MCGARFEEELNPMRWVNLILAVRWPLTGIADARHIIKCSHRRTFVEAERIIKIVGGKGGVFEDGRGRFSRLPIPVDTTTTNLNTMRPLTIYPPNTKHINCRRWKR